MTDPNIIAQNHVVGSCRGAQRWGCAAGRHEWLAMLRPPGAFVEVVLPRCPAEQGVRLLLRRAGYGRTGLLLASTGSTNWTAPARAARFGRSYSRSAPWTTPSNCRCVTVAS